jgi:hypothetical protein
MEKTWTESWVDKKMAQLTINGKSKWTLDDWDTYCYCVNVITQREEDND